MDGSSFEGCAPAADGLVRLLVADGGHVMVILVLEEQNLLFPELRLRWTVWRFH